MLRFVSVRLATATIVIVSIYISWGRKVLRKVLNYKLNSGTMSSQMQTKLPFKKARLDNTSSIEAVSHASSTSEEFTIDDPGNENRNTSNADVETSSEQFFVGPSTTLNKDVEKLPALLRGELFKAILKDNKLTFECQICNKVVGGSVTSTGNFIHHIKVSNKEDSEKNRNFYL